MALNLNAALDALGAALTGIAGLRVYDFEADSVAVPAAVIEWESVDYDATKARGLDRATFRVHVLVSKVSDRVSRDAIGAYVNGAGPASQSVKAALDAMGSHVRVTRAEYSRFVTVAGLEYKSATFEVDYVA